jgi:regulator of nucleoside diphosphate kinase
MARKPQITLSSLDVDRIEALLAAIPASVFPGKADLQSSTGRTWCRPRRFHPTW